MAALFAGLRKGLQAHFLAKLLLAASEPRDCVLWDRRLDVGGYGVVNLGGKTRKAHRLAWEILRGEVPAGLVLNHKKGDGCVGPRCINPRHLEAVTPQVNATKDSVSPAAINASKTTCPEGHPLMPPTGKRKGRWCPICARTKSKSWRSRNRDKVRKSARRRSRTVADRERTARYRAEHVEEIRKYQREWRRLWRKRNRAAVKAANRRKHERQKVRYSEMSKEERYEFGKRKRKAANRLFETLTPGERESRLERRRAYNREYIRKQRAKIMADPEAAAFYRAQHAAKERERRRRATKAEE